MTTDASNPSPAYALSGDGPCQMRDDLADFADKTLAIVGVSSALDLLRDAHRMLPEAVPAELLTAVEEAGQRAADNIVALADAMVARVAGNAPLDQSRGDGL